jgi:hypothetical protein
MTDSLILTIDLDWAPDWAIRACVDLCRRYRAPATLFATHDSPLLRQLADDPLFDIGIHPNFRPGSSHGATPSEVLGSCRAFAPKARSLRTHGFLWSSDLAETIAAECPDIAIDSSVFLPFQPGLGVTTHYCAQAGRGLLRAPVYLSDGYCFTLPDWSWRESLPPSSGLKVLLFHPLNIALNAAGPRPWQAAKAALAGRSMTELGEDEAGGWINRDSGAATFLDRLLAEGGDRVTRLGDLSATRPS